MINMCTGKNFNHFIHFLFLAGVDILGRMEGLGTVREFLFL